jgi:hypothetical protein
MHKSGYQSIRIPRVVYERVLSLSTIKRLRELKHHVVHKIDNERVRLKLTNAHA